MINWQRWTRAGLAIGALALIAVVATQFRPRPIDEPRPVERTDPTATVESTKGRSLRINLEREEVRIDYEKLLGYDDGSTRMFDVTIVTTRAEGRTFTLTAKEGRAGKGDLDLALNGDVHLRVSDGLELVTNHATYTDADGMVRAAEAVTFSRGRMSGAGVGMTYAKNTDVLTILDQAVVHFARVEEGADATDITAGSAQFERPAGTIRLERRMKLVSGAQVTEADVAVGQLTGDDQELASLELRGRSSITTVTTTTSGSAAQPSVMGRDIDITYAPGGRAIERLTVRGSAAITATAGGLGSFRSVTGQDIDITYAEGGQAIERTVVRGEAAIGLAGEPGQPGRQITARTIDVTLAPDGVTPTDLVATDAVRLTIPPEGAVGRTITADVMQARGRAPEGLTSAHFSGHVQYDERGGDVSRSARSQVLDTTMSSGLGTVEDATFSRGVRFDEGTMSANASAARYVPGKGVLELSGSEPGFLAPHLSNERLDLGATRIDVVLEGPRIAARGRVGSTLRPQAAAAAGKTPTDRKAPSMLKADQDVQVTADELVYDGQASTAVYTGSASLWQGDTKIRGRVIALDDSTGNLTAEGGVTTTAMVLQGNKDGQKSRVLSKATADELHYVESLRRATYSGSADLTDPQGELKASTIALFLTPSGEEIERIEARQRVHITIVQNHRVATGDALDYFSADERYEVRGTPVTILDECGRRNEGLTLTFFRAIDRILLGGGPQNPTQTRSDGAACP